MSAWTLSGLVAAARGWLVRPPESGGRRGAAPTRSDAASGFALPVAPIGRGARPSVAPGRSPEEPPAALALLSARREAAALGAALTLAAAGPGVGVLAAWRVARLGGVGAGVPPVPAARRVAAALAARGVRARAAGRLVVAVLPDDGDEAVDALRAAGLVAGAQALTALVGAPWDGAWEGVLLACDRVLVDAAEDAVVELAVARLRAAGANAAALDGAPSAVERALAGRGLALPGTLAPLRRVVEAHP